MNPTIDFLLLVGLCLTLADVCPSGWQHYAESCYLVVTRQMNWFEANDTCLKNNSMLAVPSTKLEHDFLWELFQGEFTHGPPVGLWIGCNDLQEEGKWLHCPLKGQPGVYENWWGEEPDESSDCGLLRVRSGGLWDAQPCWVKRYAACEFPVEIPKVFCLQIGNDGRVASHALWSTSSKQKGLLTID